MKNRSKGAVLSVVFTLLLSLFLPASYSAQKITAGASCKTLNKKTIYQNKTYTCIKKGTKLVWSKGVAIKGAAPAPTPTAAPAPTPSATPSPTSSATSVSLEFEDVSVRATGETTAEFTFRAQG